MAEGRRELSHTERSQRLQMLVAETIPCEVTVRGLVVTLHCGHAECAQMLHRAYLLAEGYNSGSPADWWWLDRRP